MLEVWVYVNVVCIPELSSYLGLSKPLEIFC